ncbi:hypothetical protein NDU88_000998 [Pleurodeles waltl]|uniref:Uncharacterized protein n=1 Tax=Pleurodeles waltl TaxID=8319 RepID=A0AAV7V890_PLEWA|nr:hypothetical protein NDU88_000998 [Pleurodeles waltl]
MVLYTGDNLAPVSGLHAMGSGLSVHACCLCLPDRGSRRLQRPPTLPRSESSLLRSLSDTVAIFSRGKRRAACAYRIEDPVGFSVLRPFRGPSPLSFAACPILLLFSAGAKGDSRRRLENIWLCVRALNDEPLHPKKKQHRVLTRISYNQRLLQKFSSGTGLPPQQPRLQPSSYFEFTARRTPVPSIGCPRLRARLVQVSVRHGWIVAKMK